MMHFRSQLRPIAVVIAMTAGLFAAAPAQAAQADLNLIQSYVGDWRGSGDMTTPEGNTETVRCTLDVTRSSDEKIGFTGRCVMAGANLSMNGTMAYISANNRYEAILTSNTTFSGRAVGRRSGNTVHFNITSTNDEGETANVRAGFGLSNGKIKVDFVVTNADGSKITADVPFDRE